MQHQLIPPPELSSPSVRHLSLAKRIELWAALVDEGDALLRANLRAMAAGEDAFRRRYREWNDRRLQQKEQDLIRFLENLTQRESRLGQ